MIGLLLVGVLVGLPLPMWSSTVTAQHVDYRVPFEIGFQATNQFNFSVFHLDAFLTVSSNLFQVEQDNISISFVKEQTDISTDTVNIDVGFVVTVNTRSEEARIRDFDEDAYRDELKAAQGMPSVIKISNKELNGDSCADAMYATFYRSALECEWLCDHRSVFNNASDECESTANMRSVVYEDARFKYAGYGGGAGVAVTVLALVAYVIRWSGADIRKSRAEKAAANTECKLQQSSKAEITSNAVLEHGDYDDAVSADKVTLSVKSTQNASPAKLLNEEEEQPTFN